MKKVEKGYIYGIRYYSDILSDNTDTIDKYMCSSKKLNINDVVIVEKKNCGLFIGKVLTVETEDYHNGYTTEKYVFYKKIDVSDFIERDKQAKRLEEVKATMKLMIKSLDEDLKLEYYANINNDFAKLFSEYNNLKKDIEG